METIKRIYAQAISLKRVPKWLPCKDPFVHYLHHILPRLQVSFIFWGNRGLHAQSSVHFCHWPNQKFWSTGNTVRRYWNTSVNACCLIPTGLIVQSARTKNSSLYPTRESLRPLSSARHKASPNHKVSTPPTTYHPPETSPATYPTYPTPGPIPVTVVSAVQHIGPSLIGIRHGCAPALWGKGPGSQGETPAAVRVTTTHAIWRRLTWVNDGSN